MATCPRQKTAETSRNNIPELPNTRLDSQTIPLDLQTEKSTIPKDTLATWTYPSQQQFYAALARKGKPVHEQHIPAMLYVHNHVNEAVWHDILLNWEQKMHPECQNPYLEKFVGRPDELSPLAWFNLTFRGAEKPFDRHDWFVNRCGKTVRYVIDYYENETVDGIPSYNMEVRPALDSLSSISDRLKNYFFKN